MQNTKWLEKEGNFSPIVGKETLFLLTLTINVQFWVIY